MAFTGADQNHCCMHLWDSRNDPDFCDVTFVVGKEGTEFNANKAIVASCSPVLKNLLFWCETKEESKESNQQIQLKQDDPVAFEAILRFAYCINPYLLPENVIKVRKIAEKYEIKRNKIELSKYCDEYVMQNISVDNVCVLFDEAVKSQMHACIQTIKTLMENKRLSKNTQTIINSNEFCQMSLETMQLFLELDCLRISEENLWDAVLRWVTHQTGSEPNDDEIECVFGNAEAAKLRKTLLKQICPFIRFGLMKANYFVRKVKVENCLVTQDIADILCYIADTNEGCGKYTTKTRTYVTSTHG
eukprot:197183_1